MYNKISYQYTTPILIIILIITIIILYLYFKQRRIVIVNTFNNTPHEIINQEIIPTQKTNIISNTKETPTLDNPRFFSKGEGVVYSDAYTLYCTH